MIVVGYSADPFGRSALEHGIAEAKLRQTNLLVINSSSGEAYVDAASRNRRRSTTSSGTWQTAVSSSSSPSRSGSTPPRTAQGDGAATTPNCW